MITIACATLALGCGSASGDGAGDGCTCPFGNVCLATGCAPGPILRYGATIETRVSGTTSSAVVVSAYTLGAGHRVLGEDGACAAVEIAVEQDTDPALAGDLTYASDAAGTLALTLASAVTMLPVAFEPDETVRFTGAGGTAFPAFDVELRAPAAVTLGAVPSPIPVDAPLSVTWEAAGAGPGTIDVALNVSPVAILCEAVPFDAGAVTIAPALLAHLPGATVGHLAIARLARARSNPPGTSVGLDLFVGHIASINTTTP